MLQAVLAGVYPFRDLRQSRRPFFEKDGILSRKLILRCLQPVGLFIGIHRTHATPHLEFFRGLDQSTIGPCETGSRVPSWV